MRFPKIVAFLLLGLIFATSAWAYPPEGTAFRIWGCTDLYLVGSWCNGGGWHEVLRWSAWVDNYDCSGTLISEQWVNNYMSCLTHGGPVGTCSEVMGGGNLSP
jgi:hypothetical protein